MRKGLIRFAAVAHQATMAICVFCLLTVLFTMTANVLLRYLFSVGFLKLQDLSLFAFSILAILSIPCAVAGARHVRVDILRHDPQGMLAAAVRWISLLVCLLPIALLLLAFSIPQVRDSIAVLEGSGQIGGLGGLFIVKAFVPVAAFLLALQGIAAFVDGKDVSEGGVSKA